MRVAVGPVQSIRAALRVLEALELLHERYTLTAMAHMGRVKQIQDVVAWATDRGIDVTHFSLDRAKTRFEDLLHAMWVSFQPDAAIMVRHEPAMRRWRTSPIVELCRATGTPLLRGAFSPWSSAFQWLADPLSVR